MKNKLFLVGQFCVAAVLFGYADSKEAFQYLFPVPGSRLVSLQTNIIIRPGKVLDRFTVEQSFPVLVTGEESSNHPGITKLCQDNKTIVFTPYVPFFLGENVTVRLKNTVRAVDGTFVDSLAYSFLATGSRLSSIPLTTLWNNEFAGVQTARNMQSKSVAKRSSAQSAALPADFPAISVTTPDSQAEGSFFMNSQGLTDPYLLILNEKGQPLFYRKQNAFSLDLTVQPTGILTYYSFQTAKSYALDSAYGIIDSFNAVGYASDVHELRVLPNGHAFLLADDPETVNMDSIVSGGNPQATVIGNIIQELDAQKNVVFQWRSWDHYKITDATHEDLTAPSIDYAHANAIDIDTDGNLLLSCRNMDEITKINHSTGAIMWRFGGKNNQFTFLNDTVGFSHQHAIRRIPNGNVTLYDDGNFHSPPFSRAVEYRLSDSSKTAELVWEYRNNPDYVSSAMGYVQRLSDGNSVIAWGSANPTVTEVSSLGKKLFELTLPTADYSYRVFCIPWKAKIFKTSVDTLAFPITTVSDSSFETFTLTNLTSVNRTITGLDVGDSDFSIQQSLPVTIAPSGSITVGVTFSPYSQGQYGRTLSIQSYNDSEGVMIEIPLTAATTSSPGSVRQVFNSFHVEQLQTIQSRNAVVILYGVPQKCRVIFQLYSLRGDKISTLMDNDVQPGNHRMMFYNQIPSSLCVLKMDILDSENPAQHKVQTIMLRKLK